MTDRTVLPVVHLVIPTHPSQLSSLVTPYSATPHRTDCTYIATTDTGIFDINQHIVRALKLWDGTVFEFDLVNSLQDKGEVLHTLATLANESGRGAVYVSIRTYLSGGSHCAGGICDG